MVFVEVSSLTGVLAVLDDLAVISTSGAMSDVAFTGSPPLDSVSTGFDLAVVDLDFSDSTTVAFVLAAVLLAARRVPLPHYMPFYLSETIGHI